MTPALKRQRSFSDEELFSDLRDGIPITEELIQRVRQEDKDALYIIGIRYSLIGNFTKGVPFLQKSAARNYSPAQHHVGTMYYLGWGVSMDYQLAMTWFLKAANNDGNTDAQISIGDMYQRGLGVTKNIHTAIEWYTKAANQGVPSADQRLAHIYEDEQEVRDLQKTANYYKKAYDGGHKHLSVEIELLNKKGYYPQDENNDQVQPITTTTTTTNNSNSNNSGEQINNGTNGNHKNAPDLEESLTARTQREKAEKEMLQNRLRVLEEKLFIVQKDKIEKETQMQQKIDQMWQAKSEMENQIKELKDTLTRYMTTLDNNPSINYNFSYQSIH